jgi:excinuclease UvrABC helicase subunit UvrB
MLISVTALHFLVMRSKRSKASKPPAARIGVMEDAAIFPATLYLAPKDMIVDVLHEIQDEMMAQVEYFKAPENTLKRNV